MRLRAGIVGPGGIAARHAGAMARLSGEVELAAVCGRDEERTGAFAAQHGGRAYVDFDRMLDEARLDLLVVALPPFAHQQEVERAAARGIHLLVEKPIALELDRANAMVAAVARSGVKAAVGFMYRHGDAVRRWREADSGRVGLMTAAYHCNALHTPWWRDEAKSGGQLLEQAIHLIDLVRHLVGEPARVVAHRANLFHRDVPGYSVEDVSAVQFRFDTGAVASVTASNIATPGIWHKDWQLFAERLTGRFEGWNDARFRSTVDASETVVAGATDVFVAQLADLIDAIRHDRAPYVPLAEGAASLRLALAARRAADEGGELCCDA